jgi:hypothetical protein
MLRISTGSRLRRVSQGPGITVSLKKAWPSDKSPKLSVTRLKVP